MTLEIRYDFGTEKTCIKRRRTTWNPLPSTLRSGWGHSLQIVGRRKSLHVRNAPKATVGRQSVARRDGPLRDIVAPLPDAREIV